MSVFLEYTRVNQKPFSNEKPTHCYPNTNVFLSTHRTNVFARLIPSAAAREQRELFKCL